MKWGRKADNAATLRQIQNDYSILRDPRAQPMLMDMFIRYGFWGPPATDAPPGARDVLIDILDRAGINHIDNLEDMTRALMNISPIRVEDETPMDDPLAELRDDDDPGTWQRPPGSQAG
jgi:hypothetical protein